MWVIRICRTPRMSRAHILIASQLFGDWTCPLTRPLRRSGGEVTWVGCVNPRILLPRCGFRQSKVIARVPQGTASYLTGVASIAR